MNLFELDKVSKTLTAINNLSLVIQCSWSIILLVALHQHDETAGQIEINDISIVFSDLNQYSYSHLLLTVYLAER